jgi:hypothetical protein
MDAKAAVAKIAKLEKKQLKLTKKIQSAQVSCEEREKGLQAAQSLLENECRALIG